MLLSALLWSTGRLLLHFLIVVAAPHTHMLVEDSFGSPASSLLPFLGASSKILTWVADSPWPLPHPFLYSRFYFSTSTGPPCLLNWTVLKAAVAQTNPYIIVAAPFHF